ncbi:hypothetical protein TrCOL_g6032 [Triparma columacea]|uniref:U-box domain-containing protein n=1 Tax=Triparma columacea TaxID=722753 RepID=A0A9W7G4M5_9STRA|nr:hypothetical protein TrCOL_g6032 [Triparma columacea]
MSSFAVPLPTSSPQLESVVDSVVDDEDYSYGLSDDSFNITGGEEQEERAEGRKEETVDTFPLPHTNANKASTTEMRPEEGAYKEGAYKEARKIEKSVEATKHRIAQEAGIQENYILGTLIVRVVEARNLPAAVATGISSLWSTSSSSTPSASTSSSLSLLDTVASSVVKGGTASLTKYLYTGTSNPTVLVNYDGNVQRTSGKFDTLEPTWEEGDERMYFDVGVNIEGRGGGGGKVVKVEVRHTESKLSKKRTSSSGARKGKDVKGKGGEEYYTPLGFCGVQVKKVLTGEVKSIDRWYNLTQSSYDKVEEDDNNEDQEGEEDERGGGKGVQSRESMTRTASSSSSFCSAGKVRIQVYYRSSEEPPKQGDTVQFNGFVSSDDVKPVPIDGIFTVDDIVEDWVTCKYTTEEDWVCTFTVHRQCLVTSHRMENFAQEYQLQVVKAVNRIGKSPALGVIKQVVEKDLSEQGLIGVISRGWTNATPVVGRWWDEGIDKIVSDVKYATNLDGSSSESSSESDVDDDFDPDKEEEYDALDGGSVALPGMPHCPITKLPMIHPVCASDGHTYERKAILRWFEGSDVSPLTGERVKSKEVVVNWGLVERVREECLKERGAEVERAEEGLRKERGERGDKEKVKEGGEIKGEKVGEERGGDDEEVDDEVDFSMEGHVLDVEEEQEGANKAEEGEEKERGEEGEGEEDDKDVDLAMEGHVLNAEDEVKEEEEEEEEDVDLSMEGHVLDVEEEVEEVQKGEQHVKDKGEGQKAGSPRK